MSKIKIISACILLSVTLLLSGCATPRPNNTQNICKIFRQYPRWYWDTLQTKKRWGLPVWIQMAVIYQESHFTAKAKPPREKLLWIIPWFRPTSAYGYSQAVDGTWKMYQRETGHHWSSRDSFGNASDFIGWYANRAHRMAGVSLYNPYEVYLAYHEGVGGYQRGSYRRKAWLIAVARRVDMRARIYRSQLRQCANSLPKPGLLYRLFH